MKKPSFYVTWNSENKQIYTNDDIHIIAENALNAAILSIQDELGQTDGGVAGIYFSGDKEEQILSLLKSYIQTEIMFKE
jgi:hypothetical protein